MNDIQDAVIDLEQNAAFKGGDTFTGNVAIEKENTNTTQGWSILHVGNNKGVGTEGNSRGEVRVYGTGTYYVSLESDPSANHTVTLPDASGTIALTSDIGNVGKLTYTVVSTF